MTRDLILRKVLYYYFPSPSCWPLVRKHHMISKPVKDDLIEKDPSILHDIQCVDFSSSFSEDQYSMIIPNKQGSEEFVSESQDSFIFSDDDDILIAAARHESTALLKNAELRSTTGAKLLDSKLSTSSQPQTSPFKSVKKLMESPKKTFISPKRNKRLASSPIQEVTMKKGASDKSYILNSLHAIKFPESKHDDSKSFGQITDSKDSQYFSKMENKNPFISPDSVINNVNVETAKKNQNDIMLANNCKFQIPKSTRTYSTKAGGNYPTIQLATQKSNNLNITTLPEEAKLKQVKPIILTSEQDYILQQAINGTSLFYTGSAGTGKSILLKSIIKALRAKYKENVSVTASTGLAACNIGGITLHSFAGVGLAAEEVNHLFKKLKRNRKAYQRWLTTKVLIIDEISMVDGHLLNKLNELAKKVRKSRLPFGGIQLIACGDFYQLPPVVKKTKPDGTDLNDPQEAFFAFESEAWNEVIQRTYMLKEIFRQKGDQRFIYMLNEMRDGVVSDQSVAEFQRLNRPVKCPAGINPAELFATRLEVDRANNTRLNKLPGDAQVYNALDSGDLPIPQRQVVLQNFLAPQKLYLKKDAQVMCIKNFDETLVNGSLGTVVDFMDRDTYLKAQESQLDETQQLNDSDYIFSLNKDDSTLEIPKLDKLTKAEFENKERKKTLGLDIEACSKNKKYPLVRFMLPDGVNTRTVLIEPEQWKVEDEQQKVLASRHQLPLILAWSLSIHKSQGQTLPRVKVDLRNVFETGQAYVALSRAVSREGLQVCNFDKFKVRSHPKVILFYKRLSSSTEEDKRRGQTKLDFASVRST